MRIIFQICFFVLLCPVLGFASLDGITEIKLNSYPTAGEINPNESVILHAEFFGKKKRGLFQSIFGGGSGSSGKRTSKDWKIEIVTENGGYLSRPFRYQEETTATKGGWTGLVSQSIGFVTAKDSVLYTVPSRTGEFRVRLTHGRLTKDLVITVSKPPLGTSGIPEFTPSDLSARKYSRLVQTYAPYIAQETWFKPRADYISRFDYDFNWKGDDNWENLETGSTQAHVYYAVMETKTHWFLHYNFFHARDYDDACLAGSCHENDYEGIILSVRKDETEHGRLELMETMAHNNAYSYSNETRIRKKVHSIDGPIEVVDGTHPIIFIEAAGHGVYGSAYKNSVFDTEKMDFGKFTGVTYRYRDGIADSPVHPNSRNVDYALIPIEDSLWPKGSGMSASGNETFENFFEYQPVGNRPGTSTKYIAGTFKGKTAGDNKAKPFWGWHDRKTQKKKLLSTGQWALDPAYSISVSFELPAELPFSTDYIYNPFLETSESP